MTSPDNLLGPPSNVALQQLNMRSRELSFNAAIDPVLGTVGRFGCPDPAKDPMACYRYLDGMRDIIRGAANQQPLIRLADKDLKVLTDITGELSASVEELMADSGQAVVTIRYDHWIEDYVINGVSITEDLHLLIDPIPTQQDWRVRWGGKVKEISVVNNEDGTASITFLALSHREHMKHLLFAAMPFFPPEIQLPRMWIMPGPIRSVFFITGMINLARLFNPLLNIITNLFNPGSWLRWLNPDNWNDFNPLHWPIQIAYTDAFSDTSMWTVLAATWTDWHSTMGDLLSNAGCMVRAYTWLTTDKDSPHTALSDLLETGNVDQLAAVTGLTPDQLYAQGDGSLGNLARPLRNCVILDCQDKSGRIGPTGTALDGLLELIGITLDDMITDVLYDTQAHQFLDGEEVIDTTQINMDFSHLLGINIPVPHAIWREGQFTGMVHREVNLHKGAPLTMMTGGRSPTIVNELQTFGIKYALAELSMVPTLSGAMGACAPVSLNQQVPATPGLDCVSRDTIIYGPDGDERIDALADRGKSFRVWSLTPGGQRVAATATLAFKKGTAELFEYTLDDGSSIKATHKHRFLTDKGYRPGASIGPGAQIATVSHADLGMSTGDVPAMSVTDELYVGMDETPAVQFRRVAAVQSVGVDDFYDMHVPIWQNYAASAADAKSVAWQHNSLYQGQLDNVLFAWERYTSPIRELHAGECAYQEYIERGYSSAYTLAAWLSLAEANWKTRPYYGFQSKALNGRPWVYGIDFALGDRCGFEMDGIIFVDQLAAVKWQYDRQNPNFLIISVGDDRDKHDPLAAAARTLQGVYALVGAFLGEGTLFG